MRREPDRLSDVSADSGSPEAKAGRLLRQARELSGPSPQALAEVLARLEARFEREPAFRARRWRLSVAVPALLLAAAALASGGALVYSALRPPDAQHVGRLGSSGPERGAVDAGAADVGAPDAASPEPPPAGALSGAADARPATDGERHPEPSAPPVRAGARPSPAPRLSSAAAERPAEGAGGDEPTLLGAAGLGADAGLSEAADAAAPDSPAEATNPAAPAPTGLAEECRLLDEALRALESGDAPGALGTLDEYRSRIPRGEMAEEAAAARADALAGAGRVGEALAALEALAPRLRTGERRALQAELLAKSGRCREAVSIFDALLSEASKHGAVEERALFGRASCRGRLGEFEASERDLRAYLELFPEGRFAAEARASLAR
ncbi:MAG: hypothetical protein ACOX6T_02100 [Myxococcales bacterium]|jgi:colicin import membrane protein